MAAERAKRSKAPLLRELQSLRAELEDLRELLRRDLSPGVRSARHFSATEVARRLHVSERTLSRWASEGGGPAFRRIASGRVYPETELEAWLEAQPLYRSTAHEDAQGGQA